MIKKISLQLLVIATVTGLLYVANITMNWIFVTALLAFSIVLTVITLVNINTFVVSDRVKNEKYRKLINESVNDSSWRFSMNIATLYVILIPTVIIDAEFWVNVVGLIAIMINMLGIYNYIAIKKLTKDIDIKIDEELKNK